MGDQNCDLMCLVTKLEIKMEIRLPFWSLSQFGCQSGHQLGSPGSSLEGIFKLLSYLAKRYISKRFGSQSGHEQIRLSNWSSSN